MSRKTKITKELILEAEGLAEAGFSHKQIYQAIGLSHTAFYENVELLETIKKAENELREKVSNSLMEKAVNKDDTTALIFLAKRLNLFSGDINISLDNPRSALKSLETLSNADISLEHKNALKGIINDYLKAYELIELEQRIEKLEDSIK